MRVRQLSLFGVGIVIECALLGAPSFSAAAGDSKSHHPRQQVIVPQEDRFTPFALTIQVGEVVEWVNNDTDDHTVVSDDIFNTTGPVAVNRLLPGTDSNPSHQPGKLRLRFRHPGTFVYYCRFHSTLDAAHQPVAPGPDGGIQGAGSIPPGTLSNFGTPMMGVITVLSDDD
jgi:plastocyanin